MAKKIIRIIAIVIGALLVIVLGYVAYAFLSFKRIDDHQELAVQNAAAGAPYQAEIYGEVAQHVPLGQELTAVSYNIGFGAYSDDFTFFMDGGKESWAFSKEAVYENIDGAMDIPMLEDVRKTLEALYERRDDFNAGTKIMVDGYTDFIFRDLNGRLYNGRRINENLRRMQKKYNEREETEAKKHRRAPELMPDFTAHTLRHTFCTRCAEQKMPIHSLQYLMGHAHPETTIRVYSSIWDTTTQDAMAMMNGKFRIR